MPEMLESPVAVAVAVAVVVLLKSLGRPCCAAQVAIPVVQVLQPEELLMVMEE